jgi:Transmembrane protein of unknown function (DUF3556)
VALPKPLLPPYDVRAWQKEPHARRLRMVCQAWAEQGYGTPWVIYVVYLLKVLAYVGGWCFFCSFTPGLGRPGDLPSWWLRPEAFQKAILFSMAFEGLGLGCGSGPLTGRYLPPLGGFLYFCRPGTTKAPLFPGLPIVGADRRGLLDVALYLAHYAFLLRALVAPAISPSLVAPTLILLLILGVLDRTLFLAARAEHYGSALVCLLFARDWVAGEKVLWVAIWLWAATSKLNGHFPAVLAVMQSNSPLTAFGTLRRRFYRRFPDDLRPSALAVGMAHAGTVVEMIFPAALLYGDGGPATRAALGVMLLFHLFITSSVPMGVPIEWNVLMVYGAFFLFGRNAAASVAGISPVLGAYLFVACFLVPLLGNAFPASVSFLCSMRYYAGNWAYSVWLFRGDAARKLDEHLVKASPGVEAQLARFYDEETTTALLSKVQAFRAMHLHGRALQLLVPRAVPDVDAYAYLDGEIVAGLVLGWNFGDGHLHGPELLAAVQRQCAFAEGELRAIFVESQPMGRSTLAWAIADAAAGIRERGEIEVRDLEALQPWPAS